MTTLSDTPTPIMLTSEAGGVSIKIEQGVLCENNDEYQGSGYNNERRGISSIHYESSQPPDTDLYGMGDDNYGLNNITHSIFQPDVKFKSEPEVDIDDRHPDESPNVSPNNKPPKIRLTPTSKLIGSPNGAADNKRRYVCPYENCTKNYGKSSHLRSHLTWHTGIKPFVCKEFGCGKGFTRSDELNRHIRTHTGEKPFECVQCSKKFSRSDHLTKHLATHTKQLVASNEALVKKIKMKKNLTQEAIKTIQANVPLPVSISNKKYDQGLNDIKTCVPHPKPNCPEVITDRLEATQIESLEIKLEQPETCSDYKIAIAKQEIKLSPSPTPEDQHLAPSMEKEADVLVKHEPLEEPHANESAVVSYENEPDDDAIMPEANLPPLIQNTETKRLVIKSKTSDNANSVVNHMAGSVYDPTRPFPCYHCTKNFKRQDDLNRHMRTHTGEKPFACTECDKRFMRSDHLKKHLNTHTRVK